jgi:hypothetical protein
MLRLALAAGMAAAALAASQPPARGAGAPTAPPVPRRWCADTTDETSRFLLMKLRPLATSDDPLYAQGRDSLAAMPRVAASEVALVTDEALCERASRALDRGFYTRFYTRPRAARVHLARAGSRYVIHPPDASMGEFGFLVFTDSAFRILACSTF